MQHKRVYLRVFDADTITEVSRLYTGTHYPHDERIHNKAPIDMDLLEQQYHLTKLVHVGEGNLDIDNALLGILHLVGDLLTAAGYEHDSPNLPPKLSVDRNEGWTERDQEQALSQGWGIFAIDGDQSRLRIERYDDDPNHTFEDDGEAIAHVSGWALRGEWYCTKAWRIVNQSLDPS